MKVTVPFVNLSFQIENIHLNVGSFDFWNVVELVDDWKFIYLRIWKFLENMKNSGKKSSKKKSFFFNFYKFQKIENIFYFQFSDFQKLLWISKFLKKLKNLQNKYFFFNFQIFKFLNSLHLGSIKNGASLSVWGLISCLAPPCLFLSTFSR